MLTNSDGIRPVARSEASDAGRPRESQGSAGQQLPTAAAAAPPAREDQHRFPGDPAKDDRQREGLSYHVQLGALQR